MQYFVTKVGPTVRPLSRSSPMDSLAAGENPKSFYYLLSTELEAIYEIYLYAIYNTLTMKNL